MNGEKNDDTVTALHNTAHVLSSLGQHEEAEEFEQRALKGARAICGQDDDFTSTILNGLGLIRARRGDIVESEAYIREALGIAQALRDEKGVAIAHHNLGLAFYECAEFRSAAESFATALELRLPMLGRSHADTIASLGGLAMARKDLVGAKAVLRDLEEVAERTRDLYGSNDVRTLTAIQNLGMAVQETGDAKRALELLFEALQIAEARLGGANTTTAGVLEAIGSALDAAGDALSACEYFLRAARTHLVACEEHPHTVRVLSNTAAFLLDHGKVEPARVLLERAEAIAKRACHANHTFLGVMFAALGGLAMEDGKPRMAIGHFERALEMATKKFGAESLSANVMRNNIERARIAAAAEAGPR